MVEIFHLKPGDELPNFSDDQSWLILEAAEDGCFFGTGRGRKQSGETVFYVSLPEDDASFDLALKAAKNWAVEHKVPCIWVQGSFD